MRKYWQISALDRKEVSHSGGTLQALLASGWLDALVTLLTQPTIDIDSTYPRLCIKQGSRSGMSGHAASKAIVSLQSLSGVPNEILLRVLEELDYPSLVNLVATNSYFWHNCRRHMFDVQASLLGLWAGEHIVCIGGDSWEEVYYSVCSQALSEVRFPRHDQRFHHEDRAWILRNLSTQEFVRAEAIAQSPKDIHGPYIDHVGFSHVVLMRICWSSYQNPSWSIDTHGMASGPWAGHCFDITTMEEHERSIKDGEQWKDVSVEVAKDLTAMLRSQIYNHG